MKQKNGGPLPWLPLAVPVLWAGAALASGYREGMTVFDLMGHFSVMLERPFAIHWTPYTLKFMLGGLVVYAFAIVLYISSNLGVAQIQHETQNQNALRLCGQAGKGIDRKLVVDMQVIFVRRKSVTVAGIVIYRRELVHICLRQGADRHLPVTLAL